MSDGFYRAIRAVSWVAFVSSGRATVIGQEHVPQTGPLLMAANHFSWYDIPVLAHHCPRLLDFVAAIELFQRPVARRFYYAMNAICCDRFNPDARAVREMLARLKQGRVVTVFPEGELCVYEHSLFTGHPIRPGMSHLALAAQVPVLPVVLLDTDVYRRFLSWMPVCNARYGLIFGAPIPPPVAGRTTDRRAEVSRFEEEYRSRMRALRLQLVQAMQTTR